MDPKPYTLYAKRFAFIAAGVLAAGGILFLLASKQTPSASPSPNLTPQQAVSSPHRYNDPETSLDNVVVTMLYFVPRDRQELVLADWQERMKKALDDMRAFHRLQFSSRSALEYSMVSEPIKGENDGAFYDSADTNRGNPHAWEAIREELDRRLGPTELSTPSTLHPTPFNVRLVLYEGVGALGGDHQILASSGYLRTDIASSVFYHELGHTFGLEDAYEYEHSAPLEEDIMGLGRKKPIGEVYLSEKAKRRMGL